MSELNLPWSELALFASLLGAGFSASRGRDPEVSRRWALLFSSICLALCVAGWLDFITPDAEGPDAPKPWSFARYLLGRDLFVIDELNAPLLPLTALVYLLTVAATPRTKLKRFSFPLNLISETLILATFASKDPWQIIGFLAVGVLPIYFNLRSRHKPTRVFVLHMGAYIACLAAGWAIIDADGHMGTYASVGLALLTLAVFIRSGIVPFHCWITDLFEHSSFGTAMLFVVPMPGVYVAVRLMLPIAPEWVLRTLGMAALITAIYAAGMVLIQREARRFFCFLLLSHKALVLVGLDTILAIRQGHGPLGLTGGLCVWLSLALSLTGVGLTLRALEARHGRLSLISFHGLGEYTPTLAVCFLLTGLATVGFPGTFGFLGTELLVDGAVRAYAYIGIAVVVVAAMNGIAMMRAYFLLFTGTKHVSTVPLAIGRRERFAVMTFAVLIIGGGILPQPMISSRHRAAMEIVEQRRQNHMPAVIEYPDDDDASMAMEGAPAPF
jgi:NADH-quinone oxidoreductase subunit M